MMFISLLLRGYTLAFKGLSLMMLASLALMLVYSQAYAIGLKENASVRGEYIRLGDVFYGLSHNEDKILGRAPNPGQDMILNARTLLRVAKKSGLSWRPASAAERVVLTREGTIIDREMIEEHLKGELKSKGLGGSYDLVFSQMPGPIILPPEMPASLDIVALNIKPDKNWFEATIMAPSRDTPILRQHVSGTIQRMISVPVIKDALRKGDVIGARDIELLEIREQSLKHGILLKREDLIGMTPRRILTPGQPIKAQDIESPILIKRGQIVTMTFAQGPLLLTARGKALENGAKNDVIRVVNINGSKTIEAQVTNAREVRVEAF